MSETVAERSWAKRGEEKEKEGKEREAFRERERTARRF